MDGVAVNASGNQGAGSGRGLEAGGRRRTVLRLTTHQALSLNLIWMRITLCPCAMSEDFEPGGVNKRS